MTTMNSLGPVRWARPNLTGNTFLASAEGDRVVISSAETRQSHTITVRENEWYVAEPGNDYIVATGGCGAVKVFVEAGESSYAVVFHSDGTPESKEVAPQIGNYILRQKDRPKAVKILCLQPFGNSGDVMDSVNRIDAQLEGAGIPTGVQAVSLNNIEGERYSSFVHLNLKGSEEQILNRYDDLRVQSKVMSKEDRAKKISLFQSLPPEVRTPEFIRDWSSLSLEQAREVAAGHQREESFWDRILSHF